MLRPFTLTARPGRRLDRACTVFLAILIAIFSTSPAFASLIRSNPDETSGTGLGAVNTVLTMQNDPSESGCVAWNGSMTVTGPAACPPGFSGSGGDETAINETRTLQELGIDSAFNLRVVFNYNEDVNDNITLQDLVLTIYDPAGNLLFDSGPFTPDVFQEPFSGTGNAGFVYRLDAEQAAQAQAAGAFANDQNRVGLAALATGSEAGPETFFVADASDVTQAEADLAITITDSPDPVAQGGTLTYTLDVTNNGPNNATGVMVTDTLPASVTGASASSTQGSCSVDGRVVTCDIGDIGVGETETITITVTAPNMDRVITNTASVGGDQADPDTTNNNDTEDTQVGAGGGNSADLSVTKTDSPDPVMPGGTLTYTVVVANAGPDAATGVTLTDTLPSSVSNPMASSSQGTCNVSGNVVTCDLGSIASGSQATVTITVTAPSQEGSITNNATASAEESDPNTANNSDSETTQVGDPSAAADLTVIKTDSPDPVMAGEPLTYTLTVINGGPNTATNVQATDTLPASVTFQSATPSQGSCAHASGVVNCDLGSINPGNSVLVDIVVIPNESGVIVNQASVSADQTETDPVDNTDSEDTQVEPGEGGPPTVEIPTLGEWGLILFALLVAGFGLLLVRRRIA